MQFNDDNMMIKIDIKLPAYRSLDCTPSHSQAHDETRTGLLADPYICAEE